jgi:anthranilate/para-aminobenzoate synthase component I
LTAWRGRLHSPVEGTNVLSVCNRQFSAYSNRQLQTGDTLKESASIQPLRDDSSPRRARQRYIRAGDIYQVNLSHRCPPRFVAQRPLCSGVRPRTFGRSIRGRDACATVLFLRWALFQQLVNVSPAPFSAYLDCGEFQIASSSPELFCV